MFLPSTSTSCLLSSIMVAGRTGHTQDNLLACGGDAVNDDPTTCEQFSPATGTWALTNHTLLEKRSDHVSWSVEEGTILIGGYYGSRGYNSYSRTSEIVKHDGTTERSFDLKYETT